MTLESHKNEHKHNKTMLVDIENNQEQPKSLRKIKTWVVTQSSLPSLFLQASKTKKKTPRNDPRSIFNNYTYVWSRKREYSNDSKQFFWLKW